MKILVLLLLFAFSSPAWGYENLYDSNDPADLGTVVVLHGAAASDATASGPQRWKSVHLQASATGVATHFLIRICTGTANAQPVGFAVYASTGQGASNPPGDTPLIRGYIPSFTFTNTGWYAFPFINNATLSVSSGTYYHLTFLVNVDNAMADPDNCRIGSPTPDKWFPDCYGSAEFMCSYEEPPGVGSEDTYAQENVYETSASWQCGLLVTEAIPVATVKGCTISGGGQVK